MSRKYRSYSAELLGSDFHDICGLQSSQPDIYRSDSYVASQTFGESVRSAGNSGIVFDSLRHKGGVNALCFIPPQITNVMQSDHFEIRSEEHTSELQSLMRISYAVFCLKKKKPTHTTANISEAHDRHNAL